MKPLILLASNTEVSTNLKMLVSEANQKGFVFSSAIPFKNLLGELKQENSKVVLINAENSKLEALELCRSLKNQYKGTIKVFVYMENSSASEGSRFGLLNAEVEDQTSTKLFCDKLLGLNNEYIIDENIICFASLNGAGGASFTSIALASMLEDYGTNALLFENSANFSLKNYLSLSTNLSLLGSNLDDNKVTNDIEWFKSFVYKSELLPQSYYLSLFRDFSEKQKFLKASMSFLDDLATDLRDETKTNARELVANSLELFKKEMLGTSFSMFNEIIGLGSKLSKNFFIDIGSDFYSSINMQFLKLAKSCLIFIKDNKDMNIEFKKFKDFFEHEHTCKLVPVLVTEEHKYNNYKNISNKEWQSILGTVPLIMPSVKDSFHTLVHRHKAVCDKKYLNFLQQLAIELDIKLSQNIYNPKGILKFLHSREKMPLNA